MKKSNHRRKQDWGEQRYSNDIQKTFSAHKDDVLDIDGSAVFTHTTSYIGHEQGCSSVLGNNEHTSNARNESCNNLVTYSNVKEQTAGYASHSQRKSGITQQLKCQTGNVNTLTENREPEIFTEYPNSKSCSQKLRPGQGDKKLDYLMKEAKAKYDSKVRGGYSCIDTDCIEYAIKKETKLPVIADANSPKQIIENPVQKEEIVNTKRDLPTPSVDTETLSHFDPLMKIVDKIADGQRVTPQITMQYEMLRFCTLRSYPKENKPFITRIAQAGFYYANSGDELVCYCCARRKSNWSESDIPMDVHRQMNPNCRFLVCNSAVNVPIKPVETLRYPLLTSCHTNHSPGVNSTETSKESQPKNSTNEIPPVVHRTVESTFQSTKNSSTGMVNRNTVQADASAVAVSSPAHHLADHVNGLSVVTSSSNKSLLNSSRPANDPVETIAAKAYPGYSSSTDEGKGTQQNVTSKYPKYASKSIRVASFKECGDIVISPGFLAETGFFYAGFGDCVRCFHCGVGLRHWSEEDDPWIEHSRWSKDCFFVKQMRGLEFVNLVQMAVQYSQNHDQNGNKTPTDSMTAATHGRDMIENLLHSDAAQSVLEMGYHPDVIRSAIGQILELNDRPHLTAVKLMEKILAIEEGENLNRAQQNATQEHDHCALNTEDKREKTEQYNSCKYGTRAKDINKNVALPNTSRAETKPTSSISRDNSDSSSLSAQYSNISKSMKPGRKQISESKRIKEENENLKQQSVCTKCKQNDVCIVFLPCGHLVTCEGCAPSLRYCSVQTCGKYVKGTVRTYLA